MKRHDVMTKKILFTLAALIAATSATAQTVSMESASAQGRAMGAVFNVGAGLLNTGIGAIGSAIKGSVGNPSDTRPAAVTANGTQGAVAVLATMSPPAPAQSAPATGSDEQYARLPRASFEAAVEKAIAVLPEDRRADVKGKAMADYDVRIARYNASNAQTNAALPLALDSVNAALRSP